MHRLKTSLSDAWSLAGPYWRSEERRRALVMLCTLVLLNLALVGTTVLFTFWQGAFYNALEAKDWRGFLGSLLWWTDTPKDGFALGFAPALAIFVFATAYELYLRQALQIKWRRWMTRDMVEDWLTDRAYFRIPLMDPGADNPDQRISEDIRLFIENALLLGLGLIRSIASLLCFVFLLWTLSEPVKIHGITLHGYLVWIALAYACAGTWFAHQVGRRLIPLHFIQQKAEADFRFSLMRLVENSEGIAFHRGEPEQERELNFRFAALVDNWRSLMTVTLRLTFFTTSYAQVVLVFPLLVVAPAYFSGRMSLGGIFQTSNAFAQVQSALSWFVQSYSDLTGWFATVQRLAGFRSAIEKIRSTCDGPSIVTDGGAELHLPGLTVTLPDGRSLLRDVELRVTQGEWLLIQGPSGAGKSTLLRTMAGIWPFGAGSVKQPAGLILFLPQRPYMPLGTLKHAVCYPRNDEHFSNHDVSLVLASVGLGHLTSALAEIDTWERRLSGGEQQRITFARALLTRPDWLFLDEATSALDPTAEDSLYTLLHEQLPAAAVISVSHSSKVDRFHHRVISIEDGILRESDSKEVVEQTTGTRGSVTL